MRNYALDERRIILGELVGLDVASATDQIVSDANAWQAQASAAGVSTNVAAAGQQAGSDAVNAVVTSVDAAGQAATTAGQAALALYQQQLTAANSAAMYAQTSAATPPSQDLQTTGQAAVAAGKQATTTASIGRAMSPGSSASAWLQQASSVTNAANAAAAAANASVQNAQATVSSMPTGVPTGAYPSDGGGGGGGSGAGGGVSEDDVDWGDGSTPGGDAGFADDGGFGGGYGDDSGGNGGYADADLADGVDWGDSVETGQQQDDIDFVNEGLPDSATPIVGSDYWMEVMGAYDIAAKQQQMNGAKPVTTRVAQALLKGGQQAISMAIYQAMQPWYKSDLPGETARKNTQDHLKWHETELAKYAGKDPNATIYPNGDDLKKWVMQAFIEANAVEEGAAYIDEAWSSMWVEIGQAIAAIPIQVARYAGSIVDAAVRASTGGVPLWGVAAIVAGVAGLLGYGVYKIAVSPTGTAIMGGASRGYFGRGR